MRILNHDRLQSTEGVEMNKSFKEKTIPLTERQVAWIIFNTFFGLMNYWTVSLTIQAPETIRLLYVMIIIDVLYAFLALGIDGRHDINPAHWIGYCLRLKEAKE